MFSNSMFRLISAFIGLALCVFAASAQVPMTGAGLGAPASGITFSFGWTAGAVEASAGTTITYSSLSFGTVDSNRIIAVVACARMATVNTISSMTIGGISASAVSNTIAQTGGTNGSNCQMFQAAVPTGTTGSVVVTYGAATARTGITVYRIVTGTTTATSSSSNNGSSNPLTCTLTLPGSGGGFVANWQSSTTTATTWTNATETYTATAAGSSRMSSATATANNPAAY